MNITRLIRASIAIVCVVGLCTPTTPASAVTERRLCQRQPIPKTDVTFRLPCGFHVVKEGSSLITGIPDRAILLSNIDGSVLLVFATGKREVKFQNAREAMHNLIASTTTNLSGYTVGRAVVARFNGKYGRANTLTGKPNSGLFAGKKVDARLVILDQSEDSLFLGLLVVIGTMRNHDNEAIFWDVMRSVRFNNK